MSASSVKGGLDKENGWHLTEEGLALCSGNVGKALDLDLKEYGSPCIPEDVNRGKLETLISSTSETGDLVLQIRNIRNVAAPKAHEESGGAPRMLKISMTDGTVTCHGIEVSRLDGISLNTHPGTKVRVAGGGRIAVANGTLMLETGCLKVLGGRVEGITDKWEVQKKLANFTRATNNRKLDQTGDSSSGPPPWISFGKKIHMGSGGANQDREGSEPKSNNEKDDSSSQEKEKLGANIDFDSQRDDAIKEASKDGSKKVFGGGNKDSIKDATNNTGVSRDKDSNKATKNGNEVPNNDSKAPRVGSAIENGEDSTRDDREGRRGGRRGRGRGRDRKGDRAGHENNDGGNGGGAATNVSLFDFFEEKFPEKKFNDKSKSRPEKPNKQEVHTEDKKRDRDSQKDKSKEKYAGGKEDTQRSKGGRGRNNEGDVAKQGGSGKHDPITFVHSETNSGKAERGGGKRGRGDRGGFKGGSRDDKYESVHEIRETRGDRAVSKEYDPPPRRQKGKNQDVDKREDGKNLGGKQPDRNYERGGSGRGRGRGGAGGDRYNYQGDNYSTHNNRDSSNQQFDRTDKGNKGQKGTNPNVPRSGNNMQSEYDTRQLSSGDNKRDRDKGEYDYSRGRGRGGRGGKGRGGRENRNVDTSDRDFGEWSNATYHDAAQRLGGNTNSQSSAQQQQHYTATQLQQMTPQQTTPYSSSTTTSTKSNQQQQYHHAGQNHNQYNANYQQQHQIINNMSNMNLNDKRAGHYEQPDAYHQRQNNGYYSNQQVDLQSTQSIPTSGQGWSNENFGQQPVMQQQSPQAPVSLPQMEYNKQRQQHHEQFPSKHHTPHKPQKLNWKVGDECMAKYWEDDQYYSVKVASLHPSGNTAVVLFQEYGNHEEVLLTDMVPYNNSPNNSNAAMGSSNAPNSSKSSIHPSSSSRGFIPTTPGLPPAFPQ